MHIGTPTIGIVGGLIASDLNMWISCDAIGRQSRNQF